MKLKNITYAAMALLLGMGMTSCEEFLNKPVEDNYNTDNYYDGDDACVSGVNYLYNSPWYDFQRGFIKVGEVMSGNMYWGSSPYMNFSTNGTDEDLVNMSYSLWAEIGHCSTVYESLQKAVNTTQKVQNQCMGECLAWKAMAYFYLVRTFGDVPIIHSNSETLAKGDYNQLYKVQKADVYEYIVMTLEKAMELLPKEKNTSGRIDYYGAEALLAKVYLTKAGVSGQLNQDDLKKAASYAKDVIENSGRTLMEHYADIFRGSNRFCDEILIAWRWTVGSQWTSQNSLQSDLAPVGFDENGDCWGGYNGPSVDLMNAFGVSPKDNPKNRIDPDYRRKATIMMAGDTYDYFWRDHTIPGTNKTGFSFLDFWYNKDYNSAATEEQQSSTGANNVKNLYGDNADHKAELSVTAARQSNALPTPLLRLADLYLIYAEAEVLQGNNSDALALECFNHVRGRAYEWKGFVRKTSLTFDDIWKERRLELAGEGDRWYDFVRRAYYDPDACIAEIKAQKRNALWYCNTAYKAYYESGNWDSSEMKYDEDTPAPNITRSSFTLPFPTEDVALNPNLGSNVEPIHVDVRNTYSY